VTLYRPRRGDPSNATTPRPFRSVSSRFTVPGETFVLAEIAGTRRPALPARTSRICRCRSVTGSLTGSSSRSLTGALTGSRTSC
jgi:hypothetical protein